MYVFTVFLLSHTDYIPKQETIANVPVRINYENFRNLLLDAFLLHWLKLYQEYPLGIKDIESVWLMKGKNRIHLDNKEHTILKHCVSPNGNKLLATELKIVFFIESDHLESVEAHCKTMKRGSKTNDFNADVDSDMVRFLMMLNTTYSPPVQPLNTISIPI